ncbi:hypothetical protein BGZ98_001528 [Dissophora globulifera]|nr:hypothetical protein BGZ98_001528 [Dissophora globulifera]
MYTASNANAYVRYAQPSQSVGGRPHIDLGPRRLRPRNSKDTKDTLDPVSTVHQQAVFAIPELLDIITSFLTLKDLKQMIRVCRSWNAFWVPYLYSLLRLFRYKRTQKNPNLWTYGEYIKALEISGTSWSNVWHILDFTTNIQSLNLHISGFSRRDLEQLVEMVPRLRALKLSLIRSAFKPMDYPLITVAAFANLEDLSWDDSLSVFRVDDILHVLKSCHRLKSLALCNITITEELGHQVARAPTAVAECRGENKSPDLIHIDDAGWESNTLECIHWLSVKLSARQSDYDESAHPHPCVRRIFQHTPNLKKVQFSHRHNLTPVDWAFVFSNRPHMQCIDISAPVRSPFDRYPSIVHGEELLKAIFGSTASLKVLDLRRIPHTTDKAFEHMLLPCHRLEKLSVSNTFFGNLALNALLVGPPSSTQTLTELDLSGCIELTSDSAALLLETCENMRSLNLSRTFAGKLSLFKGDKPWPCVKVMQYLNIDIQPQDHMPVAQGPALWATAGEGPSTYTPYLAEERQLIRSRIHSFTELTAVSIRGRAMQADILGDVHFAPKLQKAVVGISDVDGVLSGDYRDSQLRAYEIAKAMFPDWSIWANIQSTVRRTRTAVITASKDSMFFEF